MHLWRLGVEQFGKTKVIQVHSFSGQIFLYERVRGYVELENKCTFVIFSDDLFFILQRREKPAQNRPRKLKLVSLEAPENENSEYVFNIFLSCL
jgi:hypothetical protein